MDTTCNIYSNIEKLRRVKADTAGLSAEVARTANGGWLDYASAGVKLDLGRAHLDEAIPNKQRERAVEALRLMREGVEELSVWMRMNGYGN